MLTILLSVLKITGIVLLVILGTVIFLLLLILFVPVRYRLSGVKYEEDGTPVYAVAWAGWLLHIITASYEYKDRKTGFGIKILGFKLKSRKEREEKHKKKKNKKVKDKEVSYSMLEYDDDTLDIKEHSIDPKGKTHIYVDEHEETSDIYEVAKDEPVPGDTERDVSAKDGVEAQDTGDDTESKNKESLYRSLIGISQRLSGTLGSVFNTVKREIGKLTGLYESFEYYYNALTNDASNREVLCLLKKKTVQLLRAIAPRKTKGNIEYGSEDPANTGSFLALAAILYPLYGRSIIVEPRFGDSILAFDLMLKGRIYIFTLVRILLQLYFNKRLKRFISIMKKENADG